MRHIQGAAVIVVQARKEEEIVRKVGWRLAYHPDPGGELGLFPPAPTVQENYELPVQANEGALIF